MSLSDTIIPCEEIPASSAGMTENEKLGMTEKGMLGMTENEKLGMTEKGMLGMTDLSLSGLTQ